MVIIVTSMISMVAMVTMVAMISMVAMVAMVAMVTMVNMVYLRQQGCRLKGGVMCSCDYLCRAFALDNDRFKLSIKAKAINNTRSDCIFNFNHVCFYLLQVPNYKISNLYV